VFLHGIVIDSMASFFFTLSAPVSAAGIEVITYDMRGHGRSQRLATGYRLDDFVAELVGLLDALQLTEPVHLVGNSFGGTVAFSYAVAHPERVASVVMIESEPATAAWSRKLAGLFARAGDRLFKPEALDGVAERYGERSARLAGAARDTLRTTTIARDVPRSPLLSEDEIRSVGCPVLGIFGSESDLVEQGELMASLLPSYRFVLVPGQEHWVLVEAPRIVRDLLLPWIAEHDPATEPSHRGRRR
jgi:pimeloyl-ACP methyl ester carboxylesterase